MRRVSMTARDEPPSVIEELEKRLTDREVKAAFVATATLRGLETDIANAASTGSQGFRTILCCPPSARFAFRRLICVALASYGYEFEMTELAFFNKLARFQVQIKW